MQEAIDEKKRQDEMMNEFNDAYDIRSPYYSLPSPQVRYKTRNGIIRKIPRNQRIKSALLP